MTNGNGPLTTADALNRIQRDIEVELDMVYMRTWFLTRTRDLLRDQLRTVKSKIQDAINVKTTLAATTA